MFHQEGNEGKDNRQQEAASLRRRAEAILESRNEVVSEMSAEDSLRLIHELRTHQIELQIQNEELRTAQIELGEARDRYSDLYDFAPVGYVTTNRKGLILEANLTFAKILQVERGSLLGKSLVGFFVAQSSDACYQHLRQILKSEQARSVELQFELKSGLRRWVRVESVVRPGSTVGLRVRSAISDITERRRVEEDRRNLQEKMHQAQKLESLGVLAGGIAHDFNNLMAAVLMRAELAREPLPSASPTWEHLRAIEEVAKRSAGLAKQMLHFAGQGRQESEPIDLAALVDQTSPMVAAGISKKIIIEHLHSKVLPPIEADASQISQIILNLIANAADAIGDQGGAITLTTGVMTCGGEYFKQCVFANKEHDGDYVYLEVSDTGIGISEDVSARILEPFFSTKSQGRGLGLAVVLGILRSHGGALRIHSVAGLGTTMRVLLPVFEQTPAPSQPPRSKPRTKAVLSGTVLVVDDEAPLLSVLRRSMEQMGLRVLTAADGLEGVAVFRAHAEEINLVLLDRSMPGLSGEEALCAIRQVRSTVPAIFMSGYNEASSPGLVIAGKSAEFLHKPFQLEVLEKILGRLL